MSIERSKCRSCEATILWTVTQRGKRMPVDVKATPDGNVEVYLEGDTPYSRRPARGYTGPLFTSHFTTCPQSAHWRKIA